MATEEDNEAEAPWRAVYVGPEPIVLHVVPVDGAYFGLCLPINLAVDGPSVEAVQHRMDLLVRSWMWSPESLRGEEQLLETPADILKLVSGPTASSFALIVRLPKAVGGRLSIKASDLLGQPSSAADALLTDMLGWRESDPHGAVGARAAA